MRWCEGRYKGLLGRLSSTSSFNFDFPTIFLPSKDTFSSNYRVKINKYIFLLYWWTPRTSRRNWKGPSSSVHATVSLPTMRCACIALYMCALCVQCKCMRTEGTSTIQRQQWRHKCRINLLPLRVACAFCVCTQHNKRLIQSHIHNINII